MYGACCGLFFWLTSNSSHAQTLPTSAPPPPAYRNVLRLDAGGILLRNAAIVLVEENTENLVFPLLIGYERQLGRRTSANAELLVNGGNAGETTSGLALQSRYYFHQKQPGLRGFYIAPTLSSRFFKDAYFGSNQARHVLGGAGALLGAQVPVGKSGRWLLDFAGGVMAWRRLNADRDAGYSSKSYYEEQNAVPDGRISLGYNF